MDYFGMMNPFMGGFPQMMFDPRAMERLMSDPQAFMRGPSTPSGPQDAFTPSPGYNYGIPQPPNQESMKRMADMQSAHRQEQQAYVGGLEDSIEHKKDLVFDRFHYEFAEGKPKLGEDGKPKLVDGGENADSRALRRGWERNEKMALQLKHEEEKKAFYAEAQQDARQFVGGFDLNRNQKMAESYKRLEVLERQMKQRQAQDLSRVGTEGLPDLQTGGRLTDTVNQGWDGYAAMQARHKTAEDGSPEAREANAYVQSMNDYQQNLMRSMGWQPPQATETADGSPAAQGPAEEPGEEDGADLDAMRRLRFGGTQV